MILGELLAASQLDMQWHTLPPGAPKQDADVFETQALKKTGTDFPNVPTRYRSSYFLHIWANGYASGYYAYQWTVMLDDDMRLLLVARSEAQPSAREAFRRAVRGISSLQRYLEGPGLVPRSRLIAAVTQAGVGSGDVLDLVLVRVEHDE